MCIISRHSRASLRASRQDFLSHVVISHTVCLKSKYFFLFFQISWVMKPGTPYAEEDCALRASREFDPAQRGTRLGQ
jgi:hypothetical protein